MKLQPSDNGCPMDTLAAVVSSEEDQGDACGGSGAAPAPE